MVQSISFKSDNVKFNNPHKTSQMPQNIETDIPKDILVLQNADNKAEKKAKKQERYQAMTAWGTVAIGAGLVGSLLLSILIMLKGGGKTPAESEMKNLTEATIKWIDFKDKKDIVAPLNSKTTAKSLKETFNNIMNEFKLSEKAKKWGGGDDNYTNMIYLYGHGGVGKTYVAKQFAQEIGALFTSIKYPDMGSPFKDAASMKIANTFEQIEQVASKNKTRPIVVCIDEFDAVIKKINSAFGSGEADKSRAAVLTGMDAIREKCSNVIFVTTSNYHPLNGQVDEIALRRFNNQVEVPLPDKEQITGLLEMFLKKVGALEGVDFINKSSTKEFINKLQKEGYSNGEIQLIAEEAGKIFRNTLKDVKDEDLVKHPFKIEYLEKALKMKGNAASKTNKLMEVAGTKSAPKFESTKLNFWEKLAILFGNKN